jgi:hypothetical protein
LPGAHPAYSTTIFNVNKPAKVSALKKTLVLGASPNPDRYSYLAVAKLQRYQHPVVAIGNKAGNIHHIPIQTGMPTVADIDTVTLYLNPHRQKDWYAYILQLQPRRIIFNPGTENDELAELAQAKGIICQEACTLVMLGNGLY